MGKYVARKVLIIGRDETKHTTHADAIRCPLSTVHAVGALQLLPLLKCAPCIPACPSSFDLTQEFAALDGQIQPGARSGSGGKRARRHHLGVVWADGSCREPRAQSGDRGSFRAVRGAVAPRRPEHTERRAREAVRSAGEGEDVCSRTQASTRMVGADLCAVLRPNLQWAAGRPLHRLGAPRPGP